MTIDKAISICKSRIEIDRNMRDNQVISDYDEFCELHNQAMETLINCVENVRNEVRG